MTTATYPVPLKMSRFELIPGNPPLWPTTRVSGFTLNPYPYSGDWTSGLGVVRSSNVAGETSFPDSSASANLTRSSAVEYPPPAGPPRITCMKMLLRNCFVPSSRNSR